MTVRRLWWCRVPKATKHARIGDGATYASRIAGRRTNDHDGAWYGEGWKAEGDVVPLELPKPYGVRLISSMKITRARNEDYVRTEPHPEIATVADSSRTPIAHTVACFHEWRFDLQSLELTRASVGVALEPQPAKVLRELVRRAGTCVDRETLIRAVWEGRHVEQNQSLNYCIRRIRSALGDDASAPLYVETLSRRGYRFKTAVRLEVASDSLSVAGPFVRRSIREDAARRRWAFPIGMMLGCLCVLIGLWRVAAPRPAETVVSATGLGEWRDEAAAAGALRAPERLSYLMVRRWLRTRQHPGYPTVLATIDSVLDQHASFVPGRLARADVLVWMDSTIAARALLDSIVAEVPDEAEAHLLSAALSLFREADTSRAAADIARTLLLAPNSSTALHFAAYVDVARRDAAAARRHILHALRLDPLSPTLNGDAGMVLYYLGDLQTADSLCARGMRAAPEAVAPVFCRMLVAAARGDRLGLDTYTAAHAARSHWPDSVSSGFAAERYRRQVAQRFAPRDEERSVGGLTHVRWLALLGDTARVRETAAVLSRSADPSRLWLTHDQLVLPHLARTSGSQTREGTRQRTPRRSRSPGAKLRLART